MPQYKWTGNKDGNDYTNNIVFEYEKDGVTPKKSIALGGTANLTEGQIEPLQDRYIFERVSSSGSASS